MGSGSDFEIFVVDKFILCGASEYCQHRFAPGSRHKNEALVLDDFQPLNFEMFWQWINCPASSLAYDPGVFSQEPWLSNAASTWLLGKKLQCSDAFDKYALSQFVQNCAFMLFGPWALIEKETTNDSLRLFSDHWVAWNSRFAGPEPNEYSGLGATKLDFLPVTDPRTFDIEHWFSECGKHMRPKCLHDPINRLEKSEQAKQPKPELPAQWEMVVEWRREVCIPTPSYTGKGLTWTA